MFDPKEFLDQAKEMITEAHGNSEAYFRSAINRSYYSAHLVARESLLKKGLVHPNSLGIISHRTVISRIPTATEPALGDQLDYLFELRKKADYDLLTKIDENEAKGAIELSERLLSKIQSQF